MGIEPTSNRARLREVCRTFGIPRTEVPGMLRVLNKMGTINNPAAREKLLDKTSLHIFNANPLKTENTSGKEIKTKYGSLSQANIRYLLDYDFENLALVGPESGAEAEKRGLERISKNFLKSLINARTLEDSWRIIASNFLKYGIASGVRVYEVNDIIPEMKEMHTRASEGLKLDSRYEKAWGYIKGEKAYIESLLAKVSFLYMKAYNAKDTGSQKDFLDLLKRMTLWDFDGRKWDYFGLSAERLQNAWRTVELKYKKDGAVMSGIKSIASTIMGGSLSDQLAKQLDDVVCDKLCFTAEMLEDHCKRSYEEFKKLKSAHEDGSLETAYKDIVEGLKTKISSVVEQLKADDGRRDVSQKSLSANNLRELYSIVQNDPKLFESIVLHFCEGLVELEDNRIKLGVKAGEEPEGFYRRFYSPIMDLNPSSLWQIALVFCTNMQKIAEMGKPMQFFGENRSSKKNVIDALADLMHPLAMDLQSKIQADERKQDKKRDEQLLEISKILLRQDTVFDLTLSEVLFLLEKAFSEEQEAGKKTSLPGVKAEDDRMTVSLSMIESGAEKKLKIVATTDPKRLGKTPKIDGSSKDIILSWVAELKQSVSVFHGNLYIGGELKELDSLKLDAELKERLKKITDHPNQTFMCEPLISGDEILGVISVRGVRLSEKAMGMLKSVAASLPLAIKNDINSKKLKEANTELKTTNSKLESALNEKDRLFDELKTMNVRLKKMAETDDLTGLLRRNAMFKYLEADLRQCHENGQNLSVMMFDIDHFKKYNDEHNHQAGDEVLKKVTNILREEYMDGNEMKAARYGGEEMLCWFPLRSKQSANDEGERILERIESELGVTVSIGVASLKEDFYDPNDPRSIDILIDKADIALYGAKAAGRNRCYMFNQGVADQVQEARRLEKEEKEAGRRWQDIQNEHNVKTTKLNGLSEEIESALSRNDVEAAKKLNSEAKMILALFGSPT